MIDTGNSWNNKIEKDISYYRKFYKRAHYHVDISGLDVEGSAMKLEHLIEEDIIMYWE